MECWCYALLLTAAFSLRVAVARLLPNDTPDDGKVYAQIARNVLEQHVYFPRERTALRPTLIRLPGYHSSSQASIQYLATATTPRSASSRRLSILHRAR